MTRRKTPMRASTAAALERFKQLPQNDRRQILEILRQVVAGAPIDAALLRVTGSVDAPQTWRMA